MSYVFTKDTTAKMKVPFKTDATGQTLAGISATETDANIICDGIASLLACASLQGNFAFAYRNITEEVDNADEEEGDN